MYIIRVPNTGHRKFIIPEPISHCSEAAVVHPSLRWRSRHKKQKCRCKNKRHLHGIWTTSAVVDTCYLINNKLPPGCMQPTNWSVPHKSSWQRWYAIIWDTPWNKVSLTLDRKSAHYYLEESRYTGPSLWDGIVQRIVLEQHPYRAGNGSEGDDVGKEQPRACPAEDPLVKGIKVL